MFTHSTAAGRFERAQESRPNEKGRSPIIKVHCASFKMPFIIMNTYQPLILETRKERLRNLSAAAKDNGANVHHNWAQCGKPSSWLNEGESFSKARVSNLMLRNNLRYSSSFLGNGADRGRTDLLILYCGSAANPNLTDYDCPSQFGRKGEGGRETLCRMRI